MAYFDWNATAPLLPEARDAWLEATENVWANPSTAYRLGVRARLSLDSARESVAEVLGCAADQVVFTSGATEANNGMIREAALHAGPEARIWISGIEHPSVHESAVTYWKPGQISQIPVTVDGVVDLDWIEDRLPKERPALVAVMAANNETGVLQPWDRVRDVCRDNGVPFHCDAVQWLGKGPRADWSSCAGVTISGHKFGGPRGVGCLVLGEEWKGLKVLSGGAQEMDSRAGTENVPAIVAMVSALQERNRNPISEEKRRARDTFEAALKATWPGEVVIHGAAIDRLWNTCSVALPEYPSSRWITRLDRLGFEVSSGSACSTGQAGPSPVLSSMGVDPESIRRTLRISSGWETTTGDWKDLLEALIQVREFLSGSDNPSGPGRVIEI